MVTTRRQSHGESNNVVTTAKSENSGGKRARTSEAKSKARKRTKLSQSPEAAQASSNNSQDGVLMSGSLPSDNAASQPHESRNHLVDETSEEALERVESGERAVMNDATDNKDTLDLRGKFPQFIASGTNVNGGNTSKHKRFDSQEPDDTITESSKLDDVSAKVPDARSDAESDDDAPEDVQTSTAKVQSKLAASQAAKAAEEQRSKLKRRRREQDERLKKQSKALIVEQPTLSTSRSSKKTKLLDNIPTNEVPDLLPDSVLAEEPTVRPATPDLEEQRSRPSPEKVRLQRKIVLEEHPKDLAVGPVNVRILQRMNRHLPPSGQAETKSLRENWLLGRRGKASLFEKRKHVGANATFVRS